jgi:hypothetical protein
MSKAGLPVLVVIIVKPWLSGESREVKAVTLYLKSDASTDRDEPFEVSPTCS